ncbi:hypothetical protein AVEN_118538-1 [Araneus ventricosus]|uniref:Uncharacterized protein n=1 Tax=Araneus ventricosus TaxID=182803 RepID=A0A4Y2AWK6_ARAVE|nr:hypothetical protein AVEN_118538-1 [Araneus ventricosus]
MWNNATRTTVPPSFGDPYTFVAVMKFIFLRQKMEKIVYDSNLPSSINHSVKASPMVIVQGRKIVADNNFHSHRLSRVALSTLEIIYFCYESSII